MPYFFFEILFWKKAIETYTLVETADDGNHLLFTLCYMNLYVTCLHSTNFGTAVLSLEFMLIKYK